ncbi:MAG: histidine kinase dimerization/phosphoacceptor domain -containing protein, partial [Reyranella sp.]|nr:histidine kinase dimerization/phosphoacceptor domain -containing protein [Reyranella sp.]
TLRALQQRIRQQEILAELGVAALQGASFDRLLADTARLTAEGLRAEFCKVLEHVPAENRLLVRAGVGWDPGIVGQASIGVELESPAGFALRTGKPVISNHLENEKRFRTPEILQQHGIHRAMNVILQGDGRPFGVLEVDSRSEDKFVEHDLAFLQGAANILGMAIERERHERSLKAALDRHQVLLKEMSHRVKNSLMIVSSMLKLQASDIDDPALTPHLEEASYRIAAVAKAHDRLFGGPDIERMDLGEYIKSLCRDLDASVAHCVIHTEAQSGLEMSTDRAISAALIVNELITNAAKYAYKGKTGGIIRVTVAGGGKETLTISVRDEGVGLPAGFDLAKPKGLGMRIVTAFAHQLGGTLEIRTHNPGTEFIATLPR